MTKATNNKLPYFALATVILFHASCIITLSRFGFVETSGPDTEHEADARRKDNKSARIASELSIGRNK